MRYVSYYARMTITWDYISIQISLRSSKCHINPSEEILSLSNLVLRLWCIKSPISTVTFNWNKVNIWYLSRTIYSHVIKIVLNFSKMIILPYLKIIFSIILAMAAAITCEDGSEPQNLSLLKYTTSHKTSSSNILWFLKYIFCDLSANKINRQKGCSDNFPTVNLTKWFYFTQLFSHTDPQRSVRTMFMSLFICSCTSYFSTFYIFIYHYSMRIFNNSYYHEWSKNIDIFDKNLISVILGLHFSDEYAQQFLVDSTDDTFYCHYLQGMAKNSFLSSLRYA